MSGTNALGFIQAGAANIATVLLRPQRLIRVPQKDTDGKALKPEEIIADVVVEEDKEDRLVMTDHPVEQGSVITDHAYKLPATVRLTYGFSAGGIANLLSLDRDALRGIYNKLLKLQVDRTLLTIITGRRIYDNMLLESVRERNTKQTENGMLVQMTAKEVIFATTRTVAVGNAAFQASPEKNAPTKLFGPQQPRNASSFNSFEVP